MLTSRRAFLGRVGQVAGGAATAGFLTSGAWRQVEALASERLEVPARRLAADEDFWRVVQQAYTADRSLVHLNNGGVSPATRKVQEAQKGYLDQSNRAPSLTMWRHLQPNLELVRGKLARIGGVDPREVAFSRNATEALETIIFGLDLQPGDEVLTTTQDYPNMVDSWKQRELRDGIRFRQVSVPTPPGHLDDLVEIFEKGITDRTRLLMVSHVVNLTGQIFPVRRICELAHSRGIEVLVDGAHSFAHLDFRISDLGCDYFGTSLHKWLSAPFGTGMLYVRKEKIGKIWPLFGHPDPTGDDIKKFERIGTFPVPNHLAVGEAVQFHDVLGAKRKEERLRYLKDSWAVPAKEIPGVRLNTLLDPDHSCGIANFAIEGRDPKKIVHELLVNHQVVTTPILNEECAGVRVTPHVYTSLEEIEVFVDALKKIASA